MRAAGALARRSSRDAGKADTAASERCRAGHANRSFPVDVRRAPACSSTPSIRCPIARTAIASTTTRARCCWPARWTSRRSAPSGALTTRFAAFIQHAWNPRHRAVPQLHELRPALAGRQSAPRTATGGRYGRSANARADDASPSRRRWAAALFAAGLPASENFRSPRAWAFTLLGLDAYCAVTSDDASRAARSGGFWPTG